MSGAMRLVALLLLLTQIVELFAAEYTRNYDDRHLSTRYSPLIPQIIVYKVEPRRNGTRVDLWKRKDQRREGKGPVEDHFEQFAESVIFVNIMKSNLETTIQEVENSTQKLSFTIRPQQLLEMKYRIVDLMSTFQSYKLGFSQLYDKAFDFYMMGSATDVLAEDHFENVANYGMYSDIFYNVLKFKTLRDLYVVNVAETTNASWPEDLGDIPPDGVVAELSANVMTSLGDILSASKIVELIFGSELPIHNGPEWDNAYPGTVYKLMSSAKYYIKSLISYKMVATCNAIEQAKVDLTDNVVGILKVLAKHRILNALMHKTMLRIFSRLKDFESFLKTGEKKESPVSKRYFEPFMENSVSERKRRASFGVSDTTSTSSGELTPVNRTETPSSGSHVSERFSDDPEWLLLTPLFNILSSQNDDQKPADTRQNKVKGRSLDPNIIIKTPQGARVIDSDDNVHGHSMESPVSKRYFEPIMKNSVSVSDRKRHANSGVVHTPSTSSGELNPVNRLETPAFGSHITKRILRQLFNMLSLQYEETDYTTSEWRLQQNKAEGRSFEPSIIIKTPKGARVIGRDDPVHGHFVAEMQNELSRVSKVVGHQISTYLGKIITKHFIKETFGYAAPGVTDWVKFVNSGTLDGGNALIGKIGNYYSLPVVANSIGRILKSVGLNGKFDIDEKAVRAKIKASMPFAFEGILDYLKTLNQNTSRTYLRFKNLLPIFEVVKVKLQMKDRAIANTVNSLCDGRINYGYNLYLAFLKRQRYKTKLGEMLSKYVFNNVLCMFRDGNLWVEDLYSRDAVSVVTPMEQILVSGKPRRRGGFDAHTDLNIIELLVNKCYFSFVHVVCDHIPALYAERLPAIVLDLVNGFLDAQILPATCRQHDYENNNPKNQPS